MRDLARRRIGTAPATKKFIVQAIPWGTAHGLRTTMLLSPYP